MRPATTLFFILILSNSVYGQKSELLSVIDTIVHIMKTKSVNRDSVNWNLVYSNAIEKAKNAENGHQLGEACRLILQAANDFHGAIFIGDSTFKWKRAEPTLSDSITNEWKKGVFLESQVLSENIGYLRVPYMPFDKQKVVNKNAQNLNDTLCTLLSKKIKGLILDLRLNGGGAMFPMMLGLEQLYGEEKIGSFTSEDSDEWIVRDNRMYIATQQMAEIFPKCQINGSEIPVAVLIGPATGSSGEFLAISFKGRKNTVFIGSPTSGYVSSTRGFKINDAVSLLIAVCYGRDSNGRIYQKALTPDIYATHPDSFNNISNDENVLCAARWLKSHYIHNNLKRNDSRQRN